MDSKTNQKLSIIKFSSFFTGAYYWRSLTALVLIRCLVGALSASAPFKVTLKLTDAQLLDRIKGGWLAKSAGGALGGPAEGKGADINLSLPALNGNDITNCGNDDVYVQIPFLATMDSLNNGADGIYTATMQVSNLNSSDPEGYENIIILS